jgi:hypothetical protein
MNLDQLIEKINKEYETKTIREVKTDIMGYKVVKFLYSEATNFIWTLIWIFILSYILPVFDINSQLIQFIIYVLVSHFIIYKFVLKKYLFNDYPEKFQEAEMTIEILKVIKNQKLKNKNK